MNVRATLPLLAVACLLASCDGSSEWIEPRKIDVRGPGDEALRPCVPPQPAPADLEALTAGDQGALWEADRVSLANCGYQHRVLVRWAEGIIWAFASP